MSLMQNSLRKLLLTARSPALIGTTAVPTSHPTFFTGKQPARFNFHLAISTKFFCTISPNVLSLNEN